MKHRPAVKLVGAFLLATRVLAQGATVSSPVELARDKECLKPGQWVWAPQHRSAWSSDRLRRPVVAMGHCLPHSSALRLDR
jgi:hypothetical protein